MEPCKVCVEKSDQIREILRPFQLEHVDPVGGVRILGKSLAEARAQVAALTEERDAAEAEPDVRTTVTAYMRLLKVAREAAIKALEAAILLSQVAPSSGITVKESDRLDAAVEKMRWVSRALAEIAPAAPEGPKP